MTECAQSGLVVGLCPCPSVLAKLTAVVPVGILGSNCVRLAVCDSCLETYRGEPPLSHIQDLDVYPLALCGKQYTGLDNEPLLKACFDCLASIPCGAPWEGAWRENALDGVYRELINGGLIIVLASKSLEEQRAWARALIQSGCAIVQVHNAGELAKSH